jgi:predicted NBD/HSP70 family sugar kinase|tara:strand:- start:3700 stop:4911 length:1212 start_codon:yes stop_codon:yes gene_type:complete
MLEKPPKKINDPSGGANQSRVRDYNERLVLSLVRRHGSLAKSQIARRSGLSAQTVSVIMRSLENDGLLLKGEPQRGKVGQPSIPMRLNPSGVFSIGLKIGRRSADLILVDFLGNQLRSISRNFAYPTPSEMIAFTQNGILELIEKLSPSEQKRIAGLGVSMPFELWNWAEKIGAPEGAIEAWKGLDFRSELAAITQLPVSVQNDATAACGAELVFGHGKELTDFVYFFIGTFIGGGIVLNHGLYSGRTGNAGGFGPMPIMQPDGKITTLIDHASIYTLEMRLKAEGFDLTQQWNEPENWHLPEPLLDEWIADTARHLAWAIVASCSVIDFQAAVVDGALPTDIRQRIVASIRVEVGKLDTRGISDLNVLEGIVGRGARALGGASLPFFSLYLLDQNVLFKETN